MSEPTETGSGESVTLTDRSADGGVATVVVVLAESSEESLSKVELDTVAVSVIREPGDAAASTVTTRVNTSLAPAASTGLPQFTDPVPPTAGVVQLQPAGEVSEVNVVLAGIESVSAAPDAASGPALPAVIV